MAPRPPRLRRSNCAGPGLRRVRRGRGFAYLDADGEPIADPAVRARVNELAIPPAWTDVWICADPLGHLQATGVDAAGRRQYLYHPVWRERRDREKFQRMMRFAEALPRLRRNVQADLAGDGATRERVLACATRMLDLGLFRIGSEEYAEEGGGLGLATIQAEHVAVGPGSLLRFDYPAKSGVRRVHTISDPQCAELIGVLKRRRGGAQTLLAHRDGRRWVAVRSDDVNDYLKRQIGEEFSAKDFRTWNATVVAAAWLAGEGGDARSEAARRRLIAGAVRAVAEALGNTPAVARRSYIDPRVFDHYQSGWTIARTLASVDGGGLATSRMRARIERAVLALLADDTDSPAVSRLAA